MYSISDSRGTGESELQHDHNKTTLENSKIEDAILQSSSQTGGGFTEDILSKIAQLVAQRLHPHLEAPRPVVSNWSNYDLSPPSTSVIGTANTTPALNFNQPRQKNDYNDVFGKN